MLQTLPAAVAADALASLSDGLDALLAVDLVGLDRDALLDVTRRFEQFKRRLPVADHALVAELRDRSVAREMCVVSDAALLRGLLRISPSEAKRRVRAAADLGPRRTFTGETLPPLFGRVAAAQAAGTISPEHARVITQTVDELPAAIAAVREAQVEADLVSHAACFDPVELAKLGRRMLDYLDPDGTLADDADQHRLRAFTLAVNRDGSSTPAGRFTPTLTLLIQTYLDALAGPRPANDHTPDPRRPEQRNHDAIEDGLTRLLRSGELPDTGGLPAMLILTATADDAVAGTGFARTAHGGLIPTSRALELAIDGRTVSVLFDAHGGVLDYGRSQRIVPRDLRLAIIARDKGCTFPGCDRPPPWSQAHHFREWAAGGPTSIGNCGLVCGFHHREFGRRGWLGIMVDGRPHWVPPAWIDPDQKPIRNTTHDPPLDLG